MGHALVLCPALLKRHEASPVMYEVSQLRGGEGKKDGSFSPAVLCVQSKSLTGPLGNFFRKLNEETFNLNVGYVPLDGRAGVVIGVDFS